MNVKELIHDTRTCKLHTKPAMTEMTGPRIGEIVCTCRMTHEKIIAIDDYGEIITTEDGWRCSYTQCCDPPDHQWRHEDVTRAAGTTEPPEGPRADSGWKTTPGPATGNARRDLAPTASTPPTPPGKTCHQDVSAHRPVVPIKANHLPP